MFDFLQLLGGSVLMYLITNTNIASCLKCSCCTAIKVQKQRVSL